MGNVGYFWAEIVDLDLLDRGWNACNVVRFLRIFHLYWLRQLALGCLWSHLLLSWLHFYDFLLNNWCQLFFIFDDYIVFCW